MSDKTLATIIAERNERLTQLIRVLDEVERLERPFDLSAWFEGDPKDCGTAACAIGWACRDPWFQEHGLGVIGIEHSTPAYEDFTGVTAVARFFHLTYNTAEWLIWKKVDYHSPSHVKDAIRCLLGDQEDLACFF